MKFVYHKNKRLPLLAWLAKLHKEKQLVEVWSGDAVETSDSFFVAGVWDGTFEKGDFAETEFACCSGATLMEYESGWVKFSTPNHTQEMLYAIIEKDCAFVSNSAAFLLSGTDNALDKEYYHYEEDLCSGLYGLKKAKKWIPLQDGKRMYLFRCCNVLINGELHVTVRNKKTPSGFKDFDSYYKYMQVILSKIKQNATSGYRKLTYGMLSTISKGYDASASSVLAREMGCSSALTFNHPQKYMEDNGANIARILGFDCILEVDADLYKDNQEYLEAEACCSGDMGSMVVFLAHEKYYRNKLFFVGARGDSIWKKGHKNVNGDYDFSLGNELGQANISYMENALKNNMIILPVPLIGAACWKDIHRISMSEVMDTYSVGGNYDRPIPRKIVEDKGIQREDFGQEKKGAGISFHFDTISRLKKRMSPKSFESFLHYKKSLHRNIFRRMKMDLLFYLQEAPRYMNYFLNKYGIRFRWIPRRTGNTSSPAAVLLILWGMNIMVKRYKSQMQ